VSWHISDCVHISLHCSWELLLRLAVQFQAACGKPLTCSAWGIHLKTSIVPDQRVTLQLGTHVWMTVPPRCVLLLLLHVQVSALSFGAWVTFGTQVPLQQVCCRLSHSIQLYYHHCLLVNIESWCVEGAAHGSALHTSSHSCRSGEAITYTLDLRFTLTYQAFSTSADCTGLSSQVHSVNHYIQHAKLSLVGVHCRTCRPRSCCKRLAMLA
jgi:hypothetical protein